MNNDNFNALSRRDFLRRSGQLAIGSTALPFALNLAAIGDAAAFNSTDGDYKALVCVFLYGGNDYANTVVTYDDASYDLYHKVRGAGTTGQGAAGIALAKSDLAGTVLNPTVAPIDTVTSKPRQFALHPSMTALTNLFNAGQAAVLLNVGPLTQPLTRAQYDSANVHLYPPHLFSHNDQQSIWQASSPEGAREGWGGHMGDLAKKSGINGPTSSSVFTCISANQNAVFLSGNQVTQYQVSTSGPIEIRSATQSTASFKSKAVADALKALITENRANVHVLENEYNKVVQRSMESFGKASPAINTAQSAELSSALAAFPSNDFGNQLKIVARFIHGRAALGVRRQVFMVTLGGFDLHDNLIANHPKLLSSLSEGLNAFYKATVAMNMDKNVTTFTASDFGRTLTSNGDGSDHGWGNHHVIVGGAVKGKSFYGAPPPVSIGNEKSLGNYIPQDQWHVGQGRLLPTTSVDQYAATLAKWFGVSPTEMSTVLPNIGNFTASNGYPPDLGFMAQS